MTAELVWYRLNPTVWQRWRWRRTVVDAQRKREECDRETDEATAVMASRAAALQTGNEIGPHPEAGYGC